MTSRSTPTLIVLLLGFLGIIGAYVVLTITNHDASGLMAAVLSLLVGGGVVGHNELRANQQAASLDVVKAQTNGVLDQRIKNGVREVLSEAASPSVVTTPAVVAVPTATKPAKPRRTRTRSTTS